MDCDGHASDTIHHLLQSQAANLNQMKSLSLRFHWFELHENERE